MLTTCWSRSLTTASRRWKLLRLWSAPAQMMFGNPETTTGGRALKFYASVRVDIRRIAAIKEGDVVTGSRTKVKIVKNKVAAPFRESEFDIMYGEGISKEGDLLDLAVNHNLLERSEERRVGKEYRS